MNKLKRSSFFVFAIALNFAKAHVAYLGVPNHLHQVQGLYVKPSSDGTSGDLYVAATEDNAVKQWLDQPVNYLQAPISYSTSLTTTNYPGEKIVANQKRAVLSSPPIKYTYAVPVSADGNAATTVAAAAVPYPYTLPKTAGEGSECADKSASAATPYYPYPFPFYYAQMMSAFANALNNNKDNSQEEGTGSTASQVPAWPSYYPFQYMVVDPSVWAKAAAAASASAQPTSTPATSTAGAAAASNESA